MRDAIDEAINKQKHLENEDDIDFVIEQGDANLYMQTNSVQDHCELSENDFNMNLDPQNQDNVNRHLDVEDEDNFPIFLHANKKVHDMVTNFTEGELNHGIATCKSCLETRPCFYESKPSQKFVVENRPVEKLKKWDIKKDGRCERCHQDYSDIKRKKVNTVIRFSGFLSPPQDNLNAVTGNVFTTCILKKYHLS